MSENPAGQPDDRLARTTALREVLGARNPLLREVLVPLATTPDDFMAVGSGQWLASPPAAGGSTGWGEIAPSDALLKALNADLKSVRTNAKEMIAPATTGAGAEEDDMQAMLALDGPEIELWSIPTPALVKAIAASPWKVVDIETTGLTLASEPVELTAREIRAGDNAELRVRVITVTWFDGREIRKDAFDLDLVRNWPGFGGPRLVEPVARACMTGVFIGHNAGFDLGWLANLTHRRPRLVIDTMLLARALRPDVPLLLAGIVGEKIVAKRHFYYKDARTIFLSKGAGTWTLETLAAVLLNRPMEKGYQKPRNWTRAVLSAEHHEYATADTDITYQLALELLGANGPADVVEAYARKKAEHPELQGVEPQVLDVLAVRERGIPVCTRTAAEYAKRRFADAVEHAAEMAQIEPELAEYQQQLADPHTGLSRELKLAIASAFERRGLTLNYTDKAGEPKVGEKDLRLVGAERSEKARPLFKAWVAVCKAQKAGNMALDVKGFAERSPDHRVHPILAHGPQTGRLSSSEPNSQQFPGDPNFRAIVLASAGHKIAASDYSALDVRVGAALCIRAQREILRRYKKRDLPADIQAAVGKAMSAVKAGQQAGVRTAALEAITELDLAAREAVQAGDWAARDECVRAQLLHRLSWRLAEVLAHARAQGNWDWSALREAFQKDLDIHTYTALKFRGDDPNAYFDGKTMAQIATIQAALKEELGDTRKSGKVGNLGLLYAMGDAGFADYGNKGFNMGWNLAQAGQIRAQWFDAYPEVDLWHTWTALNPAGRVWVPEPGKNGNRPRDYFVVETLGGRRLVALGLNAALAFPDQGSGADIIGRALHSLRMDHPDVFATAINQVHDELVFEFPTEHVEQYSELVGRAMSQAGDHFTMPFGVPITAGCIVGDVWLKD